MGKGLTGIRNLQRKHLPDMQDWINGAILTAENTKRLLLIADYGREFARGARCGNSARRDLSGVRRVTDESTVTLKAHGNG
ncbi:MAG: hypothetical protein JM58_09270 [Peptococcaceae bacterium BICA1-8]|nr:MAG: hypothetical protein JM58_09270 [Peptococcaceae bacterium BICA1-8]